MCLGSVWAEQNRFRNVEGQKKEKNSIFMTRNGQLCDCFLIMINTEFPLFYNINNRAL